MGACSREMGLSRRWLRSGRLNGRMFAPGGAVAKMAAFRLAEWAHVRAERRSVTERTRRTWLRSSGEGSQGDGREDLEGVDQGFGGFSWPLFDVWMGCKGWPVFAAADARV